MKTFRHVSLLVIIFLAAMTATAAAGAGATGDRGARDAEMRILLNTFTALTEEHLAGIARGLRLISLTQEARSGDWNTMKGLLAQFGASGINPVAVWYARPDGRYYTVEKGLTDQSIADRPYFARLLSGKDVMGDLVVSRSTGKRAVIIAVPVVKDGKIAGALGVSVAADKVSGMLQEKMALPQEMVFYALDAKGQCALHRDSSRLFAFPSDMGSKTLGAAVKEMLSKDEGTVNYQFHGERTVFFKRSPQNGWIFALGTVTGAPSADAEIPPILAELAKETSARLDKVDAELAAAAKGLAKTGLRGTEARKILGDLCRSIPHAVDCTAVDGAGRMVTVEPGDYRRFEGADISGQEQVARLLRTGKPVMSSVIRTVEGFDAVDIEHPVFSPKGSFMGAVSVLIRPESMLSAVAADLVRGLPIDVWAMQKDGRIIYDPDQEEVGKMLFSDPIYKPFPQLLSLGESVTRERDGRGGYQFLGRGLKKPVSKDAFWTTVGLYGTEWRIVVTHTRADDGSHAKRDLAELGVKSREESLSDLAGREELQDALSEQDKEEIERIFKGFVQEYYGVYAIQWVDPRGINRFGYPEENSLANYDFHSLRMPGDKNFLKALTEKTETSFELPLVEGKEGRFFMVPVNRDGAYLGMIYMITIKP